MRAIWSLVGLLCSSLAGTLQAQHYRLGSSPWIAWAPAWVAEAQGFWKQHGIDVEVVGYTGSDANAAFAAGKVDFSLMMAGSAVGLRMQGVADPVVLAEVDWSHGGDSLVLQKGATLASLRGKRIGIYEDTPAVLMFLARKAAAEGMTLDAFEVVAIEDEEALASQFIAGRLAGAIGYEPYVGTMLGKGGVVAATTADFPGVMPEVLVAHRQRLAKMPREHEVALLRGWLDAVAWSKDPKNRDAFVRLCVSKVFFDEKVEPSEVPAMLDIVRIHGADELRARNGETGGIRTFLDECLAFAGKRAGKAPPETATMLELRGLRAVLTAAAPSK